MISLTAAAGLTDAIGLRGGDADRILASVGLDRSRLSRPDGAVPCAQFARLLETAARETRDDCFGLHFGEHFQPKNVGPLAYVVLNAPTFAAAFDDIGRYLHLHNQAARVSHAIEGPSLYLRHELLGLEPDVLRQHAEYSMAVGLNLMRLMVGSQWVPKEVQFAHKAPADTSEQIAVFRCPVSFESPTNALVVEPELLDRQVPAADERLYPVITDYLERILREMPSEDSLLGSVRRAVTEAMRDGDPSLVQVGRRLAMSPRALQRRLRESGVTFKAMVDDTRQRSSTAYLRDRKHTLTEIAYLLGYSEVSAFNRAFRRWTGSTPSQYRASAR